ncbi:MAG: hypothetical protein K9L61_00580 [Candidatus Omnitrophica bacterium]|nr:hypothetical protein [Candidatus Omnitrophota bacterium]
MKSGLRFFFVFVCFCLLITFMAYAQEYNLDQPLLNPFSSDTGQTQNQKVAPSENIISNLPLPAYTDPLETNQAMRNLGQGQGLTMKMFSTQLSIDEVREFYQRRFPALGWQKVSVEGMFSPSAMSSMNQMNLPPQAQQMMKHNLIFSKDQQMMIIAFSPSFNPNQPVTYSIAISKMPKGAQGGLFGSKEHKVDFMPVYPQAKQLNYSSKDSVTNTIYIASGNVEDVIEFYKNKMGEYGWNLSGEEPIAKRPTQSADCPTCESLPPMASSLQIEGSQLMFTNEKQENCIIGISKVSGVKMPINVGDIYITAIRKSS